MLCTTVLCPPAWAETTVIRHPQRMAEWDQRNDYFLALLTLALNQTRSEYGDYFLEPSNQATTQGRAISLLSAGEQLDVLWSMTSRRRETQMLPVRIPLLKGLMGYRLFIIRIEDETWFHSIKTIDQLRQLRAGQGHDWPDVEILRANGIRVETSSGYDALFFMLKAGRFDFFPRALNEPWQEVQARSELNLSVEKNLLLYYPTANYFFVNHNNKTLAERLTKGLEKAIADGSFDTLFYNHPINKFTFENAKLSSRIRLSLANPLLPEETPLARKELWWEIDSPAFAPDTSASGPSGQNDADKSPADTAP